MAMVETDGLLAGERLARLRLDDPHRARHVEAAREASRLVAVCRAQQAGGLQRHHLIEAGNGVMSSVGFFETSARADESTRVASNWVREEKLETALPNPPKITDGEVPVQKTREFVGA